MTKTEPTLVPPPPIDLARRTCRFSGDEGHISDDFGGTEISSLAWPEAVAVFHEWWIAKRAWNQHQREIDARRQQIREVHW